MSYNSIASWAERPLSSWGLAPVAPREIPRNGSVAMYSRIPAVSLSPSLSLFWRATDTVANISKLRVFGCVFGMIEERAFLVFRTSAVGSKVWFIVFLYRYFFSLEHHPLLLDSERFRRPASKPQRHVDECRPWQSHSQLQLQMPQKTWEMLSMSTSRDPGEFSRLARDFLQILLGCQNQDHWTHFRQWKRSNLQTLDRNDDLGMKYRIQEWEAEALPKTETLW